ncbi:hypothetical protein L1987_34764 [Smallanthus sonchifolius]|uniref:Uncharacterized protein n=1 Tax=Smallanthus sonchifolius TaxID=185202 RepID=A0ACB9HW83_9ASTR|nr:hypothetical protein L1987_34764 [Smallanthus sonchifolius]
MPSVLSLEFFIPPLATSFHTGRSCSHRLKRRLEKGDRRDLTLLRRFLATLWSLECSSDFCNLIDTNGHLFSH